MDQLVGVASRPVTSGSVRATVGTLGVLSAALAGLVTDNVVDREGLVGLDGPVLGWLLAHREPVTTGIATVVTDAGGTVAMAVLAALTGAWLLWRGRRGSAALVAATAAGAAVLLTVVKAVVGRARPPEAVRLMAETSASFPSGHTLGSTAVIGVVATMLAVSARRVCHRVMIAAAALVEVLAIGVSRLYLGVHWATDVLEGWLLGGAWLALCVGVASWWGARTARTTSAQAAAPEATP